MSIQAPQGILNIPNATLRVGKLSVDEVVGADTILNTVARNTILLVDDVAYHENKNWALKLPNAWAGEFECNTASAGNYSEFNFYNEGASSNAQGYNLTFNDTTVELRYDGGQDPIKTGTLASTVTGTGVRKVRLMFERTILSVTVDGVLVFTHDDTGGPRPRVYSTTAGGFLNFFTNGGAIKNLKIVNEKWMSDGTSNIAYVGGGEVAVGKALAFNRVSNVSQIKVDSNVVTEYTGPHDRPLRKYPEVALTADAETGSGYKGYKVTASVDNTNTFLNKWRIFNGLTGNEGWVTDGSLYDSSNDFEYISSGTSTLGGVSGEWVKLELPTKIRLSRIVMTARDLTAEQHPEDFQILGSNDDSNWTQVMNVLGAPFTQGSTLTFNVTGNVEHFRYLAVIVTRTVGHSAAAISELEYYGHEEGSGSLDTTLKSVYNVPATTGTQLEVYYDAKDLTAMPSIVTDLAGGDQNGTPGTGVSFDSTYKAFVFDGTANGKIVGTHGLSGTAPVNTCSAWFKKVSSTGNYSYISRFGANAASSQIAISIDERSSTLNKLRFEIYGASTALESELTITENVWYHVAGVYSGGTWNTNNCKLYLNGVEISLTNGTNTTTTPSITDTTLVLGSDGNSNSWDLDGSIANFRLYSKALNADQVKELYDYQKDYFLGSKSQVTLYKGHLGVGVTEPSGQLELAGDERIQEYPPRGMTDFDTYIEGHGVFTASASSEYSTNSSWRAFNKVIANTSDGWVSKYPSVSYSATNGHPNADANIFYDGVAGEWIQLDLPYSIKLKQAYLYEREPQGSTYDHNTSPRDVRILGKKKNGNNDEWVHLFSVSDLVYTQQQGSTPKVLNVNSNEFYSSYVLQLTRVGGPDGTDTSPYGWADVAEIKYFGTPGPTTLDKGSLTLGRSLDVPRVSRYDVDTETPRPEKLVVDFDTTVNSSPTDISGKGNHGTFYNGASYSPADKAFNFDGTDDLIRATVQVTPDFAHSVSVWIKVDTVGDNTFFSLGNETTVGTDLTLKSSTIYTSASGFAFVFYGGDMTIPFSYSAGRWYHIVATRETGGTFPNTQKFYIDGVDYSGSASWNNPGSTTLALPTTATLLIGKILWSTGSGFDGQISNFKLYNVALEPSEVKKLYNLGRTGRSMVISDTAVGIGKVPEAQLDVRGTANFAGNVGIGTTNPLAPLDVKAIKGNINASTMASLRSNATVRINAFNSAADTLLMGHLSTDTAGDSGDNPRFYIQNVWDNSTTGREILINPVGGSVGIGTNNPSRKFDVADQHGSITDPMVVFRANVNGASQGDGNVLRVENSGARTDTELYDAFSNGVRQFSVKASGRCEARQFDVASLTTTGFIGGDGGSSDGLFFRPDGQVYISVDDEFYFRDNDDTTSNRRFFFDTNSGNFRYEGNISQASLDYAELFEWYDGNPNGEDRVGYTVTLVEGTNKIKKMEDGDTPLGVVSATPGVIGGQGIQWHGYWEKDDWGRPVYAQQLIHGEPVFNEDGTPKMKRVKNPDYDVTLEKSYVPRDKRQEWSCIGLLGQVYIRKDCVKSPHWRKIKDVDDDKELWLINTVLPDQRDKERILELETQLASVLARLDTLESA